MRPDRALLLGLLTLTACGDVNSTAGEYTMSNNKAATSANDEARSLADAVPREDRPTAPRAPVPARPVLTAALVPLPGAELRGGATLRPNGQMSVVSVDLTGGSSHTTYEGAIRKGSCATIGRTVAALVPITADTTGAGAAISYAQLPTDSLVKGSHVVVYGKGGRPQACGPISGGVAPGAAAAPPPAAAAQPASTTPPADSVDAPSPG